MRLYKLSEVSSWRTKHLKRVCIVSCKEREIPSSWVQTAKKQERVEFLVSGTLPSMKETPDVTVDFEETDKSKGGLEQFLVDAVLGAIGGQVEGAIATAIDSTKKHLSAELGAKVDEIKGYVTASMNELRRPIQIHIDGVPTVEVDELTHHKFPEVLECLKYRKKVLMVGASGTGKSIMGKQVAEALGYDTGNGEWVYLAGTTGVSEAQLTGKMTFDGNYVSGLAVPPFENGGVLCIDEFDGLDPNCGLILNAMLDGQGVMAVPNRPKKPTARRHERFRFIGCANTFGDGRDFEYAGREQLDRATLDRFGDCMVYVDYDKEIERVLVGDYIETGHMLWSLRTRIREERIDRVISTRRFEDAQVWRKVGKTNGEILDKFLVMFTDEERSKIDVDDLKGIYA